MPAVIRAPARSNPAGPRSAGRARGASPGRSASKLNGVAGVGLERGLAVKATVVLLMGAAAVLLATGGRGAALTAAIVGGVDGRLGAMGLRVAKVELQGVSPAAAPAVLAAAGVEPGAPIMGLDLAAVRERVEGVGWIRSARVLRFLPDTLVIAAAERPRLAVWQLNGRTLVVDKDGAPIPEADAGGFPELPLVVGEGANEAASAVLPLLNARPRLMARVDALVRVDARRWDLRLKDGGLIQLPADKEDAALIQLDQLDQRARLLELGFARIDLRDPEMVTVRPRGGPAASATPPAAT